MRAYPLLFTPGPTVWSTGESNLLDRLEYLCRDNEPLAHLDGLLVTIRNLLKDPAFGPGEYHVRRYTGQLDVLRKNYPNDLLVASIQLDLDEPVELVRPPGPYPSFPIRANPLR